MGKVPCTRCGAAILDTTAQRNGGLCAPCKTGTRESIEEGKRWNQERRHREQNDPLWKLWRELVRRVHKEPEGFEGLSDKEKEYFAVGLLDGEVYNGGFDQYFTNSSADHYDWAVRGLEAMDATEALALLKQAKQVLFAFDDVPAIWDRRCAYLTQRDNKSRSERLEKINKQYWKDPDGLAQRGEVFAKKHGLAE